MMHWTVPFTFRAGGDVVGVDIVGIILGFFNCGAPVHFECGGFCRRCDPQSDRLRSDSIINPISFF